MTALEPGQCSNKERVAVLKQRRGLLDPTGNVLAITVVTLNISETPVRAFPATTLPIDRALCTFCHKLPSGIQQHLTGQLGCAGSPISIIRVVATPRTISCTCVLRDQASAVSANTQSELLLPELERDSALNVGHRPKAGPSWERLP